MRIPYHQRPYDVMTIHGGDHSGVVDDVTLHFDVTHHPPPPHPQRATTPHLSTASSSWSSVHITIASASLLLTAPSPLQPPLPPLSSPLPLCRYLLLAEALVDGKAVGWVSGQRAAAGIRNPWGLGRERRGGYGLQFR